VVSLLLTSCNLEAQDVTTGSEFKYLVEGEHGSALVTASFCQEPKIVCLLLENGADVNLAGGDYGSVLVTVCASPGYSDEAPAIQIVRLLLENGADLKSQGTRALEEALKAWHEDIVALLCRRLDGVVSDAEDHTDKEDTSSASDSERNRLQ
jgi:ankyrin repeat protein